MPSYPWNLSNKVDSINEHIDQVMEDAPTKLKVTVTVCDTDWQKMQELHNQWMEQEKQMLADQYKQQETLWRKQSHRLTEIVRNNEGVWLSAKIFYIVGKNILHCRFPFTPVNHNDCVGDCLLCVFPLDSIRPAARRDWANREARS